MATAQLTPVGVGVHNVLIATDFSHCSNEALEVGLKLAKGYAAEAYVVFVVPIDEFMMAGPEAYVAAKDAARRDLESLKAELEQRHSYIEGKDYHLYLLEGNVAHSILNFAHQEKIDLIVVGTHGRGGLGKALMGSVAERVFRGSPVPVLTIGPCCCRASHALTPKKILVAADFTPASQRAVHYAAALAREHGSNLTLLHVFNPKELERISDRGRILGVMEANLGSLLKSEPSVSRSLRVEAGRVAPAVLRVAKEIEADPLVVGLRASVGVFNRFRWPNAYEIVRESACPVLSVREQVKHDELDQTKSEDER